MTSFDEREKGFETKFSRDQEHDFKVIVRRNKLLGLWAAEKLGLKAEAAESYAKAVVEADFEKPGHDDVVEKIMGDFAKASVDISEHLVRVEMERLIEEARKQIDAQ